jgi:hypothetical protein
MYRLLWMMRQAIAVTTGGSLVAFEGLARSYFPRGSCSVVLPLMHAQDRLLCYRGKGDKRMCRVTGSSLRTVPRTKEHDDEATAGTAGLVDVAGRGD